MCVRDGAEEEEEEKKREEGDKQIIIEKKKKVTEIAIRSSADARTPTKIDVTDSEKNRS